MIPLTVNLKRAPSLPLLEDPSFHSFAKNAFEDALFTVGDHLGVEASDAEIPLQGHGLKGLD